MKIIVLKNKPLEYRTFPLYAEDGTTPLGNIVGVSDELISSKNPLMFDGERVCIDEDAKAAETSSQQKIAISNEIAKEKEYLSSTDYLLLKVMDGAMKDADYAPIKLKREEARQKINNLEKQLN